MDLDNSSSHEAESEILASNNALLQNSSISETMETEVNKEHQDWNGSKNSDATEEICDILKESSIQLQCAKNQLESEQETAKKNNDVMKTVSEEEQQYAKMQHEQPKIVAKAASLSNCNNLAEHEQFTIDNLSTKSSNNSPSATIKHDLFIKSTENNVTSIPSTSSHQQEQQILQDDYELKLQQQTTQFEQKLEQMKAALLQKENMITLFQRENAILEKEKEAFRKEKDIANKEKETTVIKFAMKEKLLLDAKKEKDVIEKQLSEAKKELKNCSLKFQAFNEEKSRVAYIMDEKCNEIRKYQREYEKLKTDYGHLESKLKYHVNKLNMEQEAKVALEKKLEEEKNAPNKLDEKAKEKLKMEFDAQTILLKHEITNKTDQLDKLIKETEKQRETLKQLQDELSIVSEEKSQLYDELSALKDEHNIVQNALSDEMLISAKLRGQLDELQVLKTKNTLNEEKLSSLNLALHDTQQKLADKEEDLKQLHEKEKEFLSFSKEMSESVVALQNEICLVKSKAQAIEAENNLLKKEKLSFDDKYSTLENELKQEQNQKNGERLLLAKHLSEKTKMYENTKMKLETILGDFEATKHKHGNIVKELQREILKQKKFNEQQHHQHTVFTCSRCNQPSVFATQSWSNGHHSVVIGNGDHKVPELKPTLSRQSSTVSCTGYSAGAAVAGGGNSRRGSTSSESETVVNSGSKEIDFKDDGKGPTKKHLVERILRLQQATARQNEKIDFLEQRTLSLTAELQKKTKVVQYYMLRDQVGALTSTKSDQNKSELAKYGNGVMSAIYSGIKGHENKSMSLELSLEINKKLQAVLEDTLLKNITLKENLDVLGLEVDNLTRRLRQLEAAK